MVGENVNSTELALNTTVHLTEWQRFRKIFFQRKLVVVGLAIVLFFVIIAIFGPLAAPYDPYVPDVQHILAKPSLAHLLGTDILGRDTLSRLIYGARTALTVGILTVTIGTSIGIVLGLIAGYLGGAISMVICCQSAKWDTF
jgi:peptide/nickel transport system permease protein